MLPLFGIGNILVLVVFLSEADLQAQNLFFGELAFVVITPINDYKFLSIKNKKII